jgi:hypothetical protein
MLVTAWLGVTSQGNMHQTEREAAGARSVSKGYGKIWLRSKREKKTISPSGPLKD